MATVFVVAGTSQFDEESPHWNAAVFLDRPKAEEYMEVLPAKIEEYLPKYFDFIHELYNQKCTSDEERNENYRLRDAAEVRFRQRTGDANFCAFMCAENVQYHIEVLELQ